MKYPRYDFLRCVWTLALLLPLGFATAAAVAQETSLKPGINDVYVNPEVEKRAAQFENEKREIAAHRDDILGVCKVAPGMDIADVGAGTGLFTRPFAKKTGPQGKVYAVDISEPFVEHIEATCEEQGIENVVGVVCTADSTTLEPQCVDLAFISDTYHHFEFPYKTMASIHRALRPGGRVVVVEFKKEPGSRQWLKDHVRMTQEEAIEEITSAGFKLTETINDMMKEQYVLVFEKVSK